MSGRRLYPSAFVFALPPLLRRHRGPDRRARARFAIVAAFLLGGAAALHLMATSAFADSPVITRYTVDPPAHLTIGDRVPVSIVIEADSGTKVEIAPGGIPQELSMAESARFATRDKGGGRVELRVDLVLSPFLVGDYSMPPIVLRFRDVAGGTGELRTPPSRLLVESTLPAGASLPGPRDLKPQAALGAPSPPPYALIALAAAAFVVAVGLMYVAWRRLQLPLTAEAPLPDEPEVLSPEDSARRQLDNAGARFADDADYAAYYAALSATVRGYLTRRFGFPAFALTTVELQSQMVFRGMDRWQARLAGGLLDQCDAVMFAEYQPALERADADLTAAYEIVEMSRPREETEEVHSTPVGAGADS